METILDSQAIQKLLPHRFPFLLVDRIVELVPRERIVGIKQVSINEPFFQGHFPGAPVMPESWWRLWPRSVLYWRYERLRIEIKNWCYSRA